VAWQIPPGRRASVNIYGQLGKKHFAMNMVTVANFVFVAFLWRHFASHQGMKNKTTFNQYAMMASIAVASPHKQPQKRSYHNMNWGAGGGEKKMVAASPSPHSYAVLQVMK